MLAFLSPLFLVGLAAAAIPIAIHLFYRRTEPVVDFAAMRYLPRARVEDTRRRRLRELLLLALRTGALVLLALAFARPYLAGADGAGNAGPLTLIMIDVSASLSAPGQLDAARQRAVRVVRDAPASHAVSVATFARTADVIAPPSPDRAGAIAAIAQLAPGAGATRYRAALQRAAEAFGGRTGRIVVITDLQQSGWDAVTESGIPEGIEVEIENVGAPTANLAVASLRVEGQEAIALVRNFSARAVTEQVVFAVGEARVGAVPLTIDAGGSAEARLRMADGRSGALSATITDREGYQADNVRYAVFDASQATAVLFLTATGHPSEALYLQRALAAADGARGFRTQALSAAVFSSRDEALDGVDVVVVAGTRGIEQRGRARLARFVQAGGGVLLTVGPDVDTAILRQALQGVVATSVSPRAAAAATFAPSDDRHPVFRVFGGAGALGVSFSQTALIAPAERAVVLARYSDGEPALVEESTSGGRVLLFGSDLNYRWNDFPLQPAFVPFVHEVVRYLASPRTARSEYVVGEPGLPPDAGPGVIELGGRPAAVNVDPAESDPTAMTSDVFRAGISRLQSEGARRARSEARAEEDTQGLWWYALMTMAVALAAEGMVGRRFG